MRISGIVFGRCWMNGWVWSLKQPLAVSSKQNLSSRGGAGKKKPAARGSDGLSVLTTRKPPDQNDSITRFGKTSGLCAEKVTSGAAKVPTPPWLNFATFALQFSGLFSGSANAPNCAGNMAGERLPGSKADIEAGSLDMIRTQAQGQAPGSSSSTR